MKSKMFFLVVLHLCMFASNAQKAPKDFENKYLVASGTHFDSEITDKKWSNTNGKSYTSASYVDYSGMTYVKLSALKPMNVSLTYEIEVKKGGLDMEVVDNNNNVIFRQSFTTSEKGMTNLELKQGGNYQIRFNGKKSKGSYFCQWSEN